MRFSQMPKTYDTLITGLFRKMVIDMHEDGKSNQEIYDVLVYPGDIDQSVKGLIGRWVDWHEKLKGE